MINSARETFYRLDNLNSLQQRISYQMSTGRKLKQGSDDAQLYTRDIYVDDKIRVYEGLKVQIERTTSQNNVSDSTLGEVKKLLTYIKAEVIKALNATTNDTGKAAIAANLRGVKENIFKLSNEQVEGEYLFTGSNTSVQPFTKDENGKITYQGDGFLRKVAVEDGSYRERGITGFETFMYTSSSALKGGNFKFNGNSRIIDQDGFEWKLNAANDTLEKYDEDGNLTTETITPVTNNGGTPPMYTATLPLTNGIKFEAKSSTFDMLDKIINALEKVDSNGNAISDTVAEASLREGLGLVTNSFDATNLGHAKLGGRNKVFEISLERVSTKLTQYNILSKKIGAVDLSKVAVEAKALELIYTALFSTIQKMNKLSLVNFLR